MAQVSEYTVRIQVDADIPEAEVAKLLDRLADEAYSADAESFEVDRFPKLVTIW